MPTRLKIKAGTIEVEYEGDEAFLKNELPNLLQTIAALPGATTAPEKEESRGSGGAGTSGANLSTSSIAGKPGCKSGPDLVLAACAHQALVRSKEQYSRSEIVAEMKTAKAFFNKNYVSNLSTSLKTLVQAVRLNEVGTDSTRFQRLKS